MAATQQRYLVFMHPYQAVAIASPIARMTTIPALSSPVSLVSVSNHKSPRVVRMIQTVHQQDHAPLVNALQVRVLRNLNRVAVLRTPIAAMTARATKRPVSKMNARRFLLLVAVLRHWIAPSNRLVTSLSVSMGFVACPLSRTVVR